MALGHFNSIFTHSAIRANKRPSLFSTTVEQCAGEFTQSRQEPPTVDHAHVGVTNPVHFLFVSHIPTLQRFSNDCTTNKKLVIGVLLLKILFNLSHRIHIIRAARMCKEGRTSGGSLRVAARSLCTHMLEMRRWVMSLTAPFLHRAHAHTQRYAHMHAYLSARANAPIGSLRSTYQNCLTPYLSAIYNVKAFHTFILPRQRFSST